ncbi:MAG TPA: helix-turn-helix domain-containing protein [Jatrophihabitantaceae bacterium]|jgi:DNA-binding transcriptional regulator YiaG
MAKTDKQFIRINDRLNEVLDEPGVRDEVDAIVAQMDEADRRYATALADLRRAAQLTQHDLGTAMGIPQGKVSRIEHGDDMLLSTFTRYLAAVGEHPRVVVTIGGHDVELELPDARE